MALNLKVNNDKIQSQIPVWHKLTAPLNINESSHTHTCSLADTHTILNWSISSTFSSCKNYVKPKYNIWIKRFSPNLMKRQESLTLRLGIDRFHKSVQIWFTSSWFDLVSIGLYMKYTCQNFTIKGIITIIIKFTIKTDSKLNGYSFLVGVSPTKDFHSQIVIFKSFGALLSSPQSWTLTARAGIRTHNLGLPRVSSPTLYPLGHDCPYPLSP